MLAFEPKPLFLQDKVILITGAGDGIGAKVAKACASYGATVVLLGRTISKLERVYDEIVETAGPKPAIYPLNLEGASPKDYAELACTIKTELGQLNAILHNASVTGDLTPIIQYDIEQWQRILHVNLTAPFMLTQACLPLLRESDDPRILFTAHRTTSAYWGAYGVSKAAIEGFMKILSDELSGNENPVWVSAINPGELQSPLIKQAFPGKNTNRLPPIDNVLPAYLYLMSKDSSHLCGRIIDSDGNEIEN